MLSACCESEPKCSSSLLDRHLQGLVNSALVTPQILSSSPSHHFLSRLGQISLDLPHPLIRYAL